jgi:hypothetical protein
MPAPIPIDFALPLAALSIKAWSGVGSWVGSRIARREIVSWKTPVPIRPTFHDEIEVGFKRNVLVEMEVGFKRLPNVISKMEVGLATRSGQSFMRKPPTMCMSPHLKTMGHLASSSMVPELR